MYIYVYLSIYLPTYLSVYLYIGLTRLVRLQKGVRSGVNPISISIYLSIDPSIYMYIPTYIQIQLYIYTLDAAASSRTTTSRVSQHTK